MKTLSPYRFAVCLLIAVSFLMKVDGRTEQEELQLLNALFPYRGGKFELRVTPEEKENIYKDFCRYAKEVSVNWDMDWTKEQLALVTPESISNYFFDEDGNRVVVSMRSPEDYFIFMQRSVSKTDRFCRPIIARALVAEKDMAVYYPPRSDKQSINPTTGKPFFPIPPQLLSQLPDPGYYQDLSTVLSSNFGAALPILSLKEAPCHDYYGMVAMRFGFTRDKAGLAKLGIKRSQRIMDMYGRWGYVYYPEQTFRALGGKLRFISSGSYCTGWSQGWIQPVVPSDSSTDAPRNGCLVFNGTPGWFNDYYQSQQVSTFSHFFNRFLCNLHAFMRKKGVEPGTPMSEPGLSAEQKLLAYWCHILHNYRLAWEQSWETGILKIFTASKPSERKEFIEQYKLKRFVDIRKKKKKDIAEPHLKINSFLAVLGKENARPLRDRSLAMTWENEAQKRLSLKSIDHETGEKSYGAFDDWMEDVAEEK